MLLFLDSCSAGALVVYSLYSLVCSIYAEVVSIFEATCCDELSTIHPEFIIEIATITHIGVYTHINVKGFFGIFLFL